MWVSLLLTFREGLEAALLVGIIFGTLRQLDRPDLHRMTWAAVLLAATLSFLLAVALQIAGAEFEGRGEMIFEGIAMLLAVSVLTWMIFWMRRQSRTLKAKIEADIRVAIRQGHNWALFSLVFVAILREGIETALFLTAANVASGDGFLTLLGGLIGLAAAVLIGWMIYAGTAQLNVRRFFDVTSILLLIFGAGLFAHALHEFAELGWLPALAEEVWNLESVLSNSSTVGGLLRVLVGYNASPTLIEVIGYLAYWGIVLFAANWWANRPAVTPSPDFAA
ncbi:MAG TPA: FTR1 family protein [Aggregatilineaceae bacterium]|nr:FTR1 family protein [Aggregatilineaceae bacterium]